jgi:MFS family permease
MLVLLVTGIGLLPIFVIMRIVSRSAGGVLPTTGAVKRRMRNATLLGFGAAASFIFFPIVGGIVGAAFDTNQDSTPALVGLLAGFLLGLAIVAWAVRVNIRLGRPRGRVTSIKGQSEYLVELRRLNPAFVDAVNAMHAARAAQQVPLPYKA